MTTKNNGGDRGLLEDFLAWEGVEKGLSPKTLEAYASDLLLFSAWCDTAGRTWLDADEDLVVAWLWSLKQAGSAPTSVAGDWSRFVSSTNFFCLRNVSRPILSRFWTRHAPDDRFRFA